MRVPKSVKGNSGHAGAERKLRELTADHLDVDGVTIDGGEDETVVPAEAKRDAFLKLPNPMLSQGGNGQLVSHPVPWTQVCLMRRA